MYIAGMKKSIMLLSVLALLASCSAPKPCGKGAPRVAPVVQGAEGKPRISIRPGVKKEEWGKGVRMYFYLDVPESYAPLLCREVATPLLEGAPDAKVAFAYFTPSFHRMNPEDREGSMFTYTLEDKADAAKLRAVQGKVRLIVRKAGEYSPVVPLSLKRRTTVCVDGKRVQLKARRLKSGEVEVSLKAAAPLCGVEFFADGRPAPVYMDSAECYAAVCEDGELRMGSSSSATFVVKSKSANLSVRLRVLSGPVHAQVLPFRISVK